MAEPLERDFKIDGCLTRSGTLRQQDDGVRFFGVVGAFVQRNDAGGGLRQPYAHGEFVGPAAAKFCQLVRTVSRIVPCIRIDADRSASIVR